MAFQGSDGPGEAGEPEDVTRVDLGELAGLRPPEPELAPPPGGPPAPPGSGGQPGAAPPPPPIAPPFGGFAPGAGMPGAGGMPGQGVPAWMPAGPASRYTVPGAPGLEYAAAVPRFVAYLIDSVVLFLVTLPISAAISSAAPGSTGAQLVGSLLGIVIYAGYFTVLWTSGGRATLGMRLLKLQLGNASDGRAIAPSQALTRWLAYGSWLPALIVAPDLVAIGGLVYAAWSLVLLITIATSPTHQGLHDRVADTAMVQPARANANQLALGCVAAVVVVGLLFLVAIVALIFLGGQVSTILSEVGGSI
jgi:uncharacterized RDD family membrane protein YckC